MTGFNGDDEYQDITKALERSRRETAERVIGARLLLNYAIDKKFNIQLETINIINDIYSKFKSEGFETIEDDIIMKQLDSTLNSLNRITSPVSSQSLFNLEKDYLENQDKKESLTRIKLTAVFTSLLSLLFIMYVTYTVENNGLNNIYLWVLPALLGLLGSSLSSIYHASGFINERIFSLEDTTTEYIHIFLGFIVGWIVFLPFLVSRGDEIITKPSESNDPEFQSLLILPFLFGFSTSLVVGMLYKMVEAVKKTFEITETKKNIKDQRNI